MIFCNVTDYESDKLVTGTNTFPKKVGVRINNNINYIFYHSKIKESSS